MSMLGAQLDDLSSLSTKLQATSSDVGSIKEQAVSLTANVVGNVVEAAKQALGDMTTQMELLSQSVASSANQAEATQWTGANADRFRQGAVEFQASMTQAGGTTGEAFQAFLQSASAMTDSLEQYVTQLATALSAAQDSATQMSSAVESQRANLDQVMNIGISLG